MNKVDFGKAYGEFCVQLDCQVGCVDRYVSYAFDEYSKISDIRFVMDPAIISIKTIFDFFCVVFDSVMSVDDFGMVFNKKEECLNTLKSLHERWMNLCLNVESSKKDMEG